MTVKDITFAVDTSQKKNVAVNGKKTGTAVHVQGENF